MLKTIKETIDYYDKLYKSIKPNDDTFKRTSDLWDSWETSEFKRPNVKQIMDSNDFEIKFFKEIVNFIFGSDKKIVYLPFILNDYNYSAFTASDGYVVLCDEKFNQLLFFIVIICTFIARNEYSRKERKELENYLRNGIIRLYINGEDTNIFTDYFNNLLKSSYDTAEDAIYIVNAIKAFMFCHEIGHHALGHTSTKEMRLLQAKDKILSYEVDSISILEEYQADDYAFDKFVKLLDVDEKRYYTFFKYRMEYSPLLFFDICNAIDKLKEKVTGNKVIHIKHPNSHKRKNKLRDTKIIERDTLYFNFRDVVFNIFKK